MASKGTNVLMPGDSIIEGDWIESTDGIFRAGVTSKGDLVIYGFDSDHNKMRVLFRKGPTEPVSGCSLVFSDTQGGRVELRGPDGAVKWWCGCQPHNPNLPQSPVCQVGKDFYLAMQGDGNLVLRGRVGDTWFNIWASDTEISNQLPFVIPGALVLTIDFASIGSSTFDKSIFNNTGERILVRDGSSQVTLDPNTQCGVASMAGTVAISPTAFTFENEIPDGPLHSFDEIAVPHPKIYGPTDHTIIVGLSAAAPPFGFTLT